VHKGVAYPGEHKAIVDDELWSAVQALLLDNRTTRRKSRIETGALLGGLVYDERQHPVPDLFGPRAPPRFSITIGWPNTRCIASWMMRAVASSAPPYGNATSIVTGRLG